MADTLIRIHYDAGWQKRLTIRGEGTGLDWEKGKEASWHVGNVWVLELPPFQGKVWFKVLIDDETWSLGGNFMVEPGERLELYPHFYQRTGKLDVSYHFDTPVITYLPPSYDENPFKHYPVIYMHDGQNLFDPATAFGGQAWAVDKTMDRLVVEGAMEEVIAVGIYNRGAARIYDFTPTRDPQFRGGVGGGADNYLDLIVDEIKPYIDTHFRTHTRREHTALMGSSLGGLVSFYMARERPDVFSKVAALSSSFWWNQANLIRRVVKRRLHIPMKIYLDAGSHDNEADTLEMYRVLKEVGYRPGEEIFCHIAERHAHSERFWGQRVHLPLRFLFPFNGISDPSLWPEERHLHPAELVPN